METTEEYKDMLRTASIAGAFAIFEWNLASVLSPFIDGWQGCWKNKRILNGRR